MGAFGEFNRARGVGGGLWELIGWLGKGCETDDGVEGYGSRGGNTDVWLRKGCGGEQGRARKAWVSTIPLPYVGDEKLYADTDLACLSRACGKRSYAGVCVCVEGWWCWKDMKHDKSFCGGGLFCPK